jgi:hypothetical protein
MTGRRECHEGRREEKAKDKGKASKLAGGRGKRQPVAAVSRAGDQMLGQLSAACPLGSV